MKVTSAFRADQLSENIEERRYLPHFFIIFRFQGYRYKSGIYIFYFYSLLLLNSLSTVDWRRLNLLWLLIGLCIYTVAEFIEFETRLKFIKFGLSIFYKFKTKECSSLDQTNTYRLNSFDIL